MPSRDYYLKARNNSMLMAYQKSRAEIAIAFGADRNTAERDAKDMVDFEIDLANVRNDFDLLNFFFVVNFYKHTNTISMI